MIDKTLGRVRGLVANKEYYEAHQAVRTVVARYTRQKNYDDAVDLLYTSALLLGRAGETGSVLDLTLYLLTIYNTAKIPVDASSKGRLAEIIWQLSPHDPGLKQLASNVTSWVSQSGGPSTGDPELHHVFGVQFSRAGEPYEAEKHLLLGTRDSAQALVDLHRRWYKEDKENAPLYASRGLLGYLSTHNIRNAGLYMEAILENISQDLKVDSIPDGNVKVFPTLPILNFLQLLFQTAMKEEAAAYRDLAKRYNPRQYDAWAESLTLIEQNYFAIAPSRAMNLMDLMGGMFRG